MKLQTHSETPHKHDHSHEHGGAGHQHFPKLGQLGLVFKLGFGLTLGFVVLEFVAGWLANSLALLSDAGHNLSDALALAFSWWAINMARRAPTTAKTYGYHRAGVLAATLNAATLIAISIYIFFEGVQRLLNPPPVEGWTIIAVASVALLVNLTVARLLHSWSKEDLNTRSAFLHIVTDAAASAGVIVAGIIQVATGWRAADPLISMLIGLLILWSGWHIIKEATDILLEGIPKGLDMVSLMRDLLGQPGVSNVHDLHVWTIGSGFRVLSCHLQMADNVTLPQANQTVQLINQELKAHYDIHHATIQVECLACEVDSLYCLTPANPGEEIHPQ